MWQGDNPGTKDLTTSRPLDPITASRCDRFSASAGADRSALPSSRKTVIPAFSPLWMGGPKPFPRDFARLLALPYFSVRLAIQVRRCKPDVVVLNSTVRPAGLFAARLAGIPVVVVVRESLMTNPTLRGLVPRRWRRWIIKRLATRIISVSEYVRSQMGGVGVVSTPDVRSASTGVTPSTKGVHASPKEFDPPLRALMLGSVSPEKGQVDAVEAVGMARSLGVEVRLTIAGGGAPEDLRALRVKVAEVGVSSEVDILDHQNSVGWLLAHHDVGIVCSRNEAYGRVTAEYVLSGMPVIAYAKGGTIEVLADGGGVLVDATPRGLANALIRYASDAGVRQRLAGEVAVAVQDNSRWGRATETLGLIQQVARRT